jgi:polyphosphate kinase
MAEIDDRPKQEAPDLESPQLYVNRELSLIEFQRRVLDEADDPSVPLLERVRFLSIFGSNMDEFFMIRLAGLKQQVAAGVREPGPDGMTPAEQLAAVRRGANEIKHEARRIWRERLVPALEAEGIRVLEYDASIEAKIGLTYFESFSGLTLRCRPAALPHFQSTNLAASTDPPATILRAGEGPEIFGRWCRCPSAPRSCLCSSRRRKPDAPSRGGTSRSQRSRATPTVIQRLEAGDFGNDREERPPLPGHPA